MDEEQNNSRKIALIVLAVASVLLLIVAFFLASRVGQSTVTPPPPITSSSSSQTSTSSAPACPTDETPCIGQTAGTDLGCLDDTKPYRCTCIVVTGSNSCSDRLVVSCAEQDFSCLEGGSSSSSESSETSSSTESSTSSETTSSERSTSEEETSTTATTDESSTSTTATAEALPDTGLFDSHPEVILIGLGLLILGGLALRFNLIDNLILHIQLQALDKTKIKQDRAEFEDRF